MNRKIVISIIAVAFAIFLGARSWLASDPTLRASGTLEARNISVGSKVGGRVTQVLVAEGDRVQPGQLLLTFDDKELFARLTQARGKLAQARANLAKMEHGSRKEDIAEARATSGYQEHAIDTYRADLERAQADLVNAQTNYHRAQKLASEGVVSRQFLDDAEARLKMAQAAAASYQHSIAAAESQSHAARAAEQRTEHGFRPEEIAAARADVTSAEGDVQQAEAQYAEREVRAPTGASVEVLDIRPGDLIPANAAVIKLLEDNQLYVMVYVPEAEIGQVRVGQKAQVRVDSFNQNFDAVVEQIRQQTEFLPRNVQTREERQHQVIGVKLRVANPEGKLRAGVHADVQFMPEKKS